MDRLGGVEADVASDVEQTKPQVIVLDGEPPRVVFAERYDSGTFARDGVLYRPAQDCSTTYGGAVVINAVVRLDTEWFEERPVDRIAADGGPYPEGRHTLTHGGGLIAIDGKRSVIDLHRSRRELVARLRRR